MSGVSDSGLVELVRGALERHAAGARTFVVAVSGGPDSVALLRLCLELGDLRPGVAGPPLHVAHFDHGLREGSQHDGAFVASLAAGFALPFHSGSAPVATICRERGWNLAAGARRLRYDFLTRTAREVGAEAILTGHTRDDQAETVLHQLTRGAAYAAGMPARRGHLVRPLLGASHAALVAYLEHLGQPHVLDPSNADTRRMRPWLRHEILARLEARIPGVSTTLARHAGIQRDVAEFMREEAERRFGDDAISVDRLRAAPVALQREAIAGLLERHGAPVDFAVIERLRERLGNAAPFRLDVAAGSTARIAYGHLDVVSGARERLEAVPIAGPADLPADAPIALLDEPGPLTLRSRRPGDEIRLRGGTKKVSDLLIDRKVPREARDALPLVARGAEVLWIEGVATAEGIETKPDPEVEAMAVALDLAQAAGAAGELPVGAVVTVDGAIVSRAHNESERSGDPTMHAEVLAVRRAADAIGRHRLAEATLVVTLEPCPMCLGAVLQAHVGRVVFGAANRRDGALGGVTDLTTASWKRTVEVRGGVLADRASKLLVAFFGSRR